MKKRQLRMKITTLPFLSLALLAGCGGGGGAVCSDGFGGGAVTSDVSSCPGCEVDNPFSAADADGDSSADLVINKSGASPNGGRISVQATSSGVTHSAGGQVGALMQFPFLASGGYTNVGVSFNTYLNGVLQEAISGSSTGFGNIDGAGSKTFYGGTSTKMFDSVAALVTLSGATTPTTVNLYEICARR